MGAAADPVPISPRLSGARILVVEDDFFIGIELASLLSDAGAVVVGPSNTVAAALEKVEHEALSAAVLDMRIGQETIAPVARLLAARHVPFLFYTGQSKADPLRTEWPDCRVLAKPALPNAIVKALMGLIATPAAH